MKYVFFVSEATSRNQLWMYKDIENEPEVSFISPWGGSNLITKAIRMIINKIGKLIRINVIKEINSYRLRINPNEEYCVIIEAGYLTTCKEKFYFRLRQHKNVKVFLLLVDSMSGHSPSLLSIRNQIINYDWDEVFTFEKADAEKYGWNYSGINCSSLPTRKQINSKYDIYFVGGLKGGRNKLLFPTYDRLTRNGVICKFDLWYQSESERKDSIDRVRKIKDNLERTGIKDNGTVSLRKHFLKYSKVADIVQASNVILEILQEGQMAHTLRWFEAIYYNKKLLTNNPNICNLPFYNEKYMKIISSVEDIDISWVLQKDNIEYGYSGELSPIHLLEKIRAKAEVND